MKSRPRNWNKHLLTCEHPKCLTLADEKCHGTFCLEHGRIKNKDIDTFGLDFEKNPREPYDILDHMEQAERNYYLRWKDAYE